ncbi:DNA adenine methylase [Nocardioides sp. 1609]|uniref:DNA adenine methylase n=1 Tax=Nocardioides sp. 1609 TaxID=2508327 RepID=UPI001431218A|nr:DNA adenine methylase [Nocardioides sp. 1609]
MGNKTAILTPLMDTIAKYADPGDHVVDAFSGSLAVSLGLKNSGYRVTANDINLFSAIFGDAYLIPDEPPITPLADLIPDRTATSTRPDLRREAEAIVANLVGAPGFTFLNKPVWRDRYVDYVAVLTHLQTMTADDLAPEHRRSHFFDTYCEEGANAAFVSSRGTSGRRRFLIPLNAERLDLAINQVRAWFRDDLLDTHLYSLLLAGLVRSIETVSNTQGTFHDFIRTGWDSRSLRPIQFKPLPLDDTLGGPGGHRVGREQDTIEFISDVDHHAVLYLDPPYNFRQYTAYYFLANVICRYPTMPDPDAYFADVRYVRGQNPADDFTSTLCKPRRFIDDMTTLIGRSRSDTVVVSYYTGPNHWGSFDTDPTNVGRQHLTDMLTGDLFESGTLEVVEVPRRNYASYGGFKARDVTELLMIARRRDTGPHGSHPTEPGPH